MPRADRSVMGPGFRVDAYRRRGRARRSWVPQVLMAVAAVAFLAWAFGAMVGGGG